MPHPVASAIRTVGIVGLGTMGAGIAEVFARGGLSVVGLEPAEDALARGRGHLERSTGRAVQRGRLAEGEQQAIHDRVTFTTRLADLAQCDLVIEAIPERLDLKRELFAELDRICPSPTILATNTSSLSVTDLAASTGRPDRVVGLHFFNPAPVMRFVEVVRTVVTADEVVVAVEELAQRLGKVDVTVRDRAGFIGNALLFGYLNDAVTRYEAGFASREDIDTAMTAGYGLPMGPLALLDLIGIDTANQILQAMYAQSGNRRHVPSPLLRQMATAGVLGRKTGRGFYSYAGVGSGAVVPDAETPADPPPPEQAAGARIGLVGSGAVADDLLDRCHAAGYQVLRVAVDSTGSVDSTPEGLAEVDLVLQVGATTATGADRVPTVSAALRPGAVVAMWVTDSAVLDAAVGTDRPQDVVGVRLRRPGPGTRGDGVLEIARTVVSSDAAVDAARGLAARLGIASVVCGDHPGLLADALLFPYLNDAVRMLATHYASADDIDAAMTLGCGYPAGPLAMLDELGLDHVLTTLRRLHDESGDPGLAPAPLLQQLVTAGRTGGSSERGLR